MTAKPPRRGSGAAIAAALVALLVLIGFVVVLLLPGPSPGELIPSASPEPTPSATPDAAQLGERLTVLLVGNDLDAERRADGMSPNSDTLILASIGPHQSEVTLIGLPRDTVDIPLPGGELWQRKVNALWAAEGPAALVGAMEELFAVPVDGYVKIEMDDLAALVDAAGGVTVDPPEPLADPIVNLELAAGEQELDGATALAYVRTRADTDYGRMARQQEVLLDLVARLVEAEADVDVAALLSDLDSLETDLPLDDLPTLLEIGRRAQDAAVTRQVLRPTQFITFEGNAGDGRGYILLPDVEAIRDFAARHLTD
jgi:LCP family protein required for cell wall assembly